MRLFPGDYVPNLSVAPQELPTAWVMPWYLSRSHKDRLWALFVRGLQRFDERLHFVDLRWSERHLIEGGRIRLSQPVVARWRVDALSSEDPEAVVRFAFKWTRSGAVFEFDVDQDVPSFGWLGPFKVRVMHRMMDVLLDYPPLEDPQSIVNVLQEAAGLLLTPIELIDFIEVMLERVMAGLSLESARGMAFGDAIAARFETVTNADVMEKVLREAAGSGLSAMAMRALTRVGLYELGARIPLLDLVRDPEIRQRALEAFARRMGEARWVEDSFEEKNIKKPQEVADVRDAVMEALPKTEPASPIVRDALARILDGRSEEGAKLLLDALRDGTAKGFSKEDAAVAGSALWRVARDRMRVELGEGAADYFEFIGDFNRVVEVMVWVAHRRLRHNDVDAARAALFRAQQRVTNGLSPEHEGRLYMELAELHRESFEFESAKSRYRQAVAIFDLLGEGEAKAEVLESLGDLCTYTLDLREASQCLNEACAVRDLISDEEQKAYLMDVLGTLHVLSADFVTAMKYYEKALSGCDERSSLLGSVLTAIGDIRLRMGDAVGALSTFEEAFPEHNPYAKLGVGDTSLRWRLFDDVANAYQGALQRFHYFRDPQGESRALRAIAKLKFISGEPFQEELDASEKIATDIHDIHGLWLSKTLRAATLVPVEALPPLTECETFWNSKGLPWELCITRGLLAMFRDEPPDCIENILAPMIKSRAEVVGSLVKKGRTKDAIIAVLIELPTS